MSPRYVRRMQGDVLALGPVPTPEVPDGVRRSEQKFNVYLEVVRRSDDENGAARAYDARGDRGAPARWDS